MFHILTRLITGFSFILLSAAALVAQELHFLGDLNSAPSSRSIIDHCEGAGKTLLLMEDSSAGLEPYAVSGAPSEATLLGNPDHESSFRYFKFAGCFPYDARLAFSDTKTVWITDGTLSGTSVLRRTIGAFSDMHQAGNSVYSLAFNQSSSRVLRRYPLPDGAAVDLLEATPESQIDILGVMGDSVIVREEQRNPDTGELELSKLFRIDGDEVQPLLTLNQGEASLDRFLVTPAMTLALARDLQVNQVKALLFFPNGSSRAETLPGSNATISFVNATALASGRILISFFSYDGDSDVAHLQSIDPAVAGVSSLPVPNNEYFELSERRVSGLAVVEFDELFLFTDGSASGTFSIPKSSQRQAHNMASPLIAGDDHPFHVAWTDSGQQGLFSLTTSGETLESSWPAEFTIWNSKFTSISSAVLGYQPTYAANEGSPALLINRSPLELVQFEYPTAIGTKNSNPIFHGTIGEHVVFSAKVASGEFQIFRAGINNFAAEALATLDITHNFEVESFGESISSIEGVRMFLNVRERIFSVGESGPFVELPLPAGEKRYFFRTTDRLYLSVCADQECTLWRTSGTPAGTEEVSALPGEQIFPIGPGLVADNQAVPFVARFGTQSQLFSTRGAPGEGPLALEGFPRSAALRNGARRIDGLWFYVRCDSTDCELWGSDGTAAGTTLIRGFPGFAQSRINIVGEFSGELLFSTVDGSDGYTLWRSDGTAEGTSSFGDLIPGPRGLEAYRIFHGATLSYLFAVVESESDPTDRFYEVWATDGTPLGTRFVTRLAQVGFQCRPLDGFVRGNVFVYSSECGGTSVATPQGSAFATLKLLAGRFIPLSNVDGKLITAGYALNFEGGAELYLIDPEQRSTLRLFDLNPFGNGFVGSYGTSAVVDDTLFFSGSDGVTGVEPYAVRVSGVSVPTPTPTASPTPQPRPSATPTKSPLPVAVVPLRPKLPLKAGVIEVKLEARSGAVYTVRIETRRPKSPSQRKKPKPKVRIVTTSKPMLRVKTSKLPKGTVVTVSYRFEISGPAALVSLESAKASRKIR